MSVGNHDRWNVQRSAELIRLYWCCIWHCWPILMMSIPAEVSQVFCNTAHGYGLGSSRSFFWQSWGWGSEMLSLLWYQCVRSMWVWCWCGHQGTWQKWVSRVVLWRLYFAFTGLLFKVMASHFEGLNSISESFSHSQRLSRSDWSVLVSCMVLIVRYNIHHQQISKLWNKLYSGDHWCKQ